MTVYDRKGAKNPKWKGGRRVRKDGYVLVYSPGHPYAYRNFVLEHRLVMEKHVGRYLPPDELVHHKNENKSDNRIENLELTNSVDHAAHHFTGKEYPNRWQPKVDRETLVRLYVTENRSMAECGKAVGISYGSTRFHLAFYGIDIRPGQRKRKQRCPRLARASQLSLTRGNKGVGSSMMNSSPLNVARS